MFINIIKEWKLFKILVLFFVLFMGFYIIVYSGNNTNRFFHDELIVPILTYHKFSIGESPDAYTININLFEQQMAFIKDNDYQVISVSQLLDCIENNNFPEKPVVITIDDGFRSTYTLAFPVLKKYRFPATLYLYTDFIGHGPNQLSWQEIREMMDYGLEVGSHSLSHPNLLYRYKNESHMDYLKRINRELVLSKEILEQNTGRPVKTFAYPYGVYSKKVKMLAKQAGYKGLLNVNGMNNSIPINPYSLNRQNIPAGCSIKRFQAILNQKTLQVNHVFPPDGTVTNDQGITVGAILNNPNIDPGSLSFRLSGSGIWDYTYIDELQEISFTPVAPRLLQKRTWIAQIIARDEESKEQRKVSWIFTVE